MRELGGGFATIPVLYLYPDYGSNSNTGSTKYTEKIFTEFSQRPNVLKVQVVSFSC